MRIDDLLLEQAMCEAPQRRLIEEHSFHQPLVLRIYRWSEPTLSLGHFQRVEDLALAADTQANPQLREIPWVKRKTGGGAILHDLELTYSIIVPATWSFQAGTVRTLPDRSGSFDPSKGHSEGLYRAVHDSVVSGLIELGISASLSESCTCKVAGRESTEGEPFLCFHRRTPVDVVVGEHKVLGSAQRRSRFGLLQHGSLLIRSSGQIGRAHV